VRVCGGGDVLEMGCGASEKGKGAHGSKTEWGGGRGVRVGG